MIIIATLIQALATILHSVVTLYIWIVIISAIVSYVKPDPYNPLIQMLYRLTNPVYAWIRRYVPTVIGGIDLAPLIVVLALQFIDLFAIKLLFALANAL